MKFSKFLLIGISSAALLAVGTGCARYPASGGLPGQKRLTFTMQMAQDINPNYIYIVALNPSTDENPTSQGPLPVIAPPWGNGFVAGTATHFVRWDNFQSPRYQVFAFQDAQLLNFIPTGVPVNYIDVVPGSRQIKFEIELSQIAGTVPLENLKSIQVNLLTMNVVPIGGSGDKIWDALGDGRVPSQINDFVTIPIRNGIYNNAIFQNREPNGDVIDPSLDIVDWSIEIRS